ncbi:MAG: hypothetical protein EPO21_20015 [Chloroflexota bacterium]|nr:MAG: hypothetical protein EPO21_20015 [Chloroflexota bacterium]
MAVLSLSRPILSRLAQHGDARAVACLLLLPLVFLWASLFGGKVLLPIDNLYSAPPWTAGAEAMGVGTPHNHLIGDMIFQNFGWKSFARDSFARGDVPLWNPNIFGGMPFLAGGQSGSIYPPGVVFYILPVEQAYGWFTALHLFLAGLFTYFLLRVIGSRPLGALIAGITFAYSGFLVVSFLWPMILSAAVWLPLFLALIELTARRAEGAGRGWLSPWLLVPAGGLTVGLQLLAGHLEISFYFLFSAMIFAVCRLALLLWRTKRPLQVIPVGSLLLAMVVLGAGIALVQLWPFYDLIKENFRSGLVSYQDVVGWALPKSRLITFLVPDFFGNPAVHDYLSLVDGTIKSIAVTTPNGSQQAFIEVNPARFKNYVEGASYVGVLPLLLAVLALWRRKPQAWIFAGYAALCLLLAFGAPIYRLFWVLPGIDQLHSTFRWIYPYTLCVAVLAGLGADALARGLVPRRVATALGSLTLGAGAILMLGLAGSRVLFEPTLYLIDTFFAQFRSFAMAFGDATLFYSFETRNLAVFGAMLALSGLLIVVRRPIRWYGLLAGLVVVDLFLFGFVFNSSVDEKLLGYVPGSVAFLRSDPEPYRVVSFDQGGALQPNTAMLAGIQDVRGYDTVIPRQYVEYWSLLEKPSGLLYSQIDRLMDPRSLQSPLLDLLNVKYVLTTASIGLPNLEEVYRGEISIYRNTRVLPRAFMIDDPAGVTVARDKEQALGLLSKPSFDPRRSLILEGDVPFRSWEKQLGQPAPTVDLEYQGSNRVILHTSAASDGYLVLSDSYFPGWRALLDGAEAPVLRANRIFRGVFVPAGDHEVQLRYDPLSFRVGSYISLLFALAAGLSLAVGLRKVLPWGRGETSTIQRIMKNSLMPMAAQLLNKAMDFGFAVYMAWLLGPEGVGKYTLAVVLIGYFYIFTDFGLGTLLTREVAKDRAVARGLLGHTLALRLWLVIACTPILLAVVGVYRWQLGMTNDTALAVLLLAASMLPSGANSALSAAFNGFEKMEFPAFVTILTNVLRVGLGVAALVAGYGIVGLAATTIVVNLSTTITLYILVRRELFTPGWRHNRRAEWSMVRTAFPLMINNFLSTIFFRIDVLLLSVLSGAGANVAIGWYSTAYKFIDGLNFIPSLFTLALFPVMSRYADSAPDSLLRTYRVALKVLLIIGLPITIGTTVTADKIILLVFGQEYAPSALALQVLIWFLPFSFVNSVTQYVLIAVNRQRFLTGAFVIGAAFNILANAIAIPLFGYLGAAVVTILSEIVLMVPFMYAVHKHVGVISLPSLAARPIIAAAVMGAAVWWLRAESLPILLLASAVVYTAALLAVGILRDDDMALLAELMPRRWRVRRPIPLSE